MTVSLLTFAHRAPLTLQGNKKDQNFLSMTLNITTSSLQTKDIQFLLHVTKNWYIFVRATTASFYGVLPQLGQILNNKFSNGACSQLGPDWSNKLSNGAFFPNPVKFGASKSQMVHFSSTRSKLVCIEKTPFPILLTAIDFSASWG